MPFALPVRKVAKLHKVFVVLLLASLFRVYACPTRYEPFNVVIIGGGSKVRELFKEQLFLCSKRLLFICRGVNFGVLYDDEIGVITF